MSFILWHSIALISALGIAFIAGFITAKKLQTIKEL